MISDDGFYSILEASEHMSRDAKQRIEDAVRIANEQSLIEGVNRRQATQNAVAKVNKQGITGMIAKNGAEIPADKYMAGVVQYHQRKAHVTGTENMAVQNGQDLVYVNFVGITCSLCAKYQDRVYSISGNDKRFLSWTCDRLIIVIAFTRCQYGLRSLLLHLRLSRPLRTAIGHLRITVLRQT